MKLEGIPANVVMGATGAGKTTLILQLLAQKPPGERWAVLINDFGPATLVDPGLGSTALFVRAVAGCMCCTAQIGLRVALVSLLRDARPQRLLIEAAAAAEPESVLCVLRERGIAPAIELGVTLTVMARHQLAESRYIASAVYRRQVEAADVVLMSAATDEDLSAARDELAASGLAAKRLERWDTFDLHALGAARRADDRRPNA